MNRLEFQQNLQAARAQWDALIEEAQVLGDEAMEVRPEDDGWSVKDYVAHNIWYEREILRLLATRNLPYPPSDELWATRDSERNKVLYDMFCDMPLTEVLDHLRNLTWLAVDFGLIHAREYNGKEKTCREKG